MTEDRQRILLCIPALEGGPGRVLLNLLRHLDRGRVEVILGVTDGGQLLGGLPSDVRMVQVGRAGQRYPVRGLAKVVRQLAPDVVLTTLRMSFTALAASPSFPRRTGLVVRQANHVGANQAELATGGRVKASLIDGAYHALLRRADLVICQSRAMQADLVSRRSGGQGAVVVPNPVDVDGIRSLSQSGTVDASLGAPTFVSAGRLSHQKGYDLLLSAFARFLQDHATARLWILGDGPDKSALEHQARKLRIDHAVDLLGFRRNPYPYFQAADIFVSSSRYEGLPNVVLEAFACGTPAIATSGPGAGEDLVIPGRSGWLASPGSVAALTDSLSEAARTFRALPRDELPRWCDERYGVRSVTRRYETVLTGVGRSTRSSTGARGGGGVER